MNRFWSAAPGRAALLSVASAVAATAHAAEVNVNNVLLQRLAPEHLPGHA